LFLPLPALPKSKLYPRPKYLLRKGLNTFVEMVQDLCKTSKECLSEQSEESYWTVILLYKDPSLHSGGQIPLFCKSLGSW
jgi:hypothetical protein